MNSFKQYLVESLPATPAGYGYDAYKDQSVKQQYIPRKPDLVRHSYWGPEGDRGQMTVNKGKNAAWVDVNNGGLQWRYPPDGEKRMGAGMPDYGEPGGPAGPPLPPHMRPGFVPTPLMPWYEKLSRDPEWRRIRPEDLDWPPGEEPGA
jgi:hypothetical protein